VALNRAAAWWADTDVAAPGTRLLPCMSFIHYSVLMVTDLFLDSNLSSQGQRTLFQKQLLQKDLKIFEINQVPFYQLGSINIYSKKPALLFIIKKKKTF
jgi:hypothetical protein